MIKTKSPVHEHEGQWYFWDETWADRVGPFSDREDAVDALADYCEELNLDGDEKSSRMIEPGHTVREENGVEIHKVDIAKLEYDVLTDRTGTSSDALPDEFIAFADENGVDLDHLDDYLPWWEFWCHGYRQATVDLRKEKN